MPIDFRSRWRYSDGSAQINTVRCINGEMQCTCTEYRSAGICAHIKQVADEEIYIENEQIHEPPPLRVLREQAQAMAYPMLRKLRLEMTARNQEEFYQKYPERRPV